MSCFKRRLKLSDVEQAVIDVSAFLCHTHISTLIAIPPATPSGKTCPCCQDPPDPRGHGEVCKLCDTWRNHRDDDEDMKVCDGCVAKLAEDSEDDEASGGEDTKKDAKTAKTPAPPKETAGGDENKDKTNTTTSRHDFTASGTMLTLNDVRYNLGTSWTLQDGTQGKVGCVVKTKHHPKRSYVCLVILQRTGSEPWGTEAVEQYIACCLLPQCERQMLMRHAVFPLKDITSAEMMDTPTFDKKTFTELGEKFLKNPTEVDSTHAKPFELKKRSRRSTVTPIDPAKESEEEREEEEETGGIPNKKKQKLKAAAAGTPKPKDGEATYICTLTCGNGKKCGKRFQTRIGLGNHSRTHKKTPKSAKPKKTRTSTRRAGQVTSDSLDLKLTVTMEAYKAMTASVGMPGRKIDEIRCAGKAWVESRLDGRKYDYVKLYGGVPGFYETAPWTLFHCLGYSKAGAAGESYRVQGMGTGEGWELWFQGEVWEIHLGVVVERHYGAQEDMQLSGLPRPDFDADLDNDFDDFDSPAPPGYISAGNGKLAPKKQLTHNIISPAKPAASSGAVSSGDNKLDLAACKGYADIFTSIQKGPMDILKEMMKLQAEKNNGGGTHHYSIEQMASMKGLFSG
jgi:hypothetical protein